MRLINPATGNLATGPRNASLACGRMPQQLRKHKVGDHVLVKLSGGRTVQATIKAAIDTTDVCVCRCHSEMKQR